MSPFVVLGVIVALLAVAFVIYPIIASARGGGPGGGEIGADSLSPAEPASSHELAERRRAIYRQIVDVEFDQRLGKLDETDAHELSRELLRQAAALLAAESAVGRELEGEIEREIRAVRRALAAAREAELDTVQT